MRSRRRSEHTSRPWTLLWVSFVAALLTVVGYVLGLSWVLSASAALAVVGLFGVRYLGASGADEGWPVRPEAPRDVGARREIARLSWSLQGQDNKVDRRSVHRLRTIAARRLAERGIDLDSAADEAAVLRTIGQPTLAVLDAEPNHLPRYEAFVAAMTEIERLPNPTGNERPTKQESAR